MRWAMLALASVVLLPTTEAFSQTDLKKETARMQLSEFCAHVKRPPQAIADLLNQLAPHNPQLMPAVHWWNKVVERYKELGCGDI